MYWQDNHGGRTGRTPQGNRAEGGGWDLARWKGSGEQEQRARGLGCPDILGFEREWIRGPNIGGRQLWTCSRDGCVCQHRGHRGQVSSVEWGARSRCKQSKIAMKVLGEHLLSQMRHIQYALRSYPVMAGSRYMEVGHNIGSDSSEPSWRL